MTQKRGPYVFAFAFLAVLALAAIAQQSLTEAPAAFASPTLSQNPGSQSVSNGITEPAGDTYALDQATFEKRHGVDDGLGPVFNATACVDCHQNPVTGGPSQITEIRAGHLDANGNFVNPTIPINDGGSTIAGRSIVDDRAICPEAHEQVPDTENVRALRAVLNTLGDGFVEAIDDNTLLTIAANQAPAARRGHRRRHRTRRPARYHHQTSHRAALGIAHENPLHARPEIGIAGRRHPPSSRRSPRNEREIPRRPVARPTATAHYILELVIGEQKRPGRTGPGRFPKKPSNVAARTRFVHSNRGPGIRIASARFRR